MSLIREEIAFIKGNPEKLVIFLHGYIDNATILQKAIQPFIDKADNIAIHLPEAPLVCEIHDSTRQWYSMHRFDPNDDRKTVKTLQECMDIYDHMGPGLSEAYSYLKIYIENTLSEYNLAAADLILCGFSQGATLALYTSLMLEEEVKACFSFGGVVTPGFYLQKHRKSNPDIVLIHGDKDPLVRFEILEHNKKLLEKIGCKTEIIAVKDGRHRILEEGLNKLIKTAAE